MSVGQFLNPNCFAWPLTVCAGNAWVGEQFPRGLQGEPDTRHSQLIWPEDSRTLFGLYDYIEMWYNDFLEIEIYLVNEREKPLATLS